MSLRKQKQSDKKLIFLPPNLLTYWSRICLFPVSVHELSLLIKARPPSTMVLAVILLQWSLLLYITNFFCLLGYSHVRKHGGMTSAISANTCPSICVPFYLQVHCSAPFTEELLERIHNHCFCWSHFSHAHLSTTPLQLLLSRSSATFILQNPVVNSLYSFYLIS